MTQVWKKRNEKQAKTTNKTEQSSGYLVIVNNFVKSLSIKARS